MPQRDPVVYAPPYTAPWGDGDRDRCQLLGAYQVKHFCKDFRQGTITVIPVAGVDVEVLRTQYRLGQLVP